MIYTCIGQGQITFGDKILMSTEIPYHFAHLLTVLKNISLKSNFFTVFYGVFFHMYIAPGRGRQPIGDKDFMTTLCPYVASFKLISSKSDFKRILMILYMYTAPGQGQKTPWGQTFDVNRKPLTTSPICCTFQTNLF